MKCTLVTCESPNSARKVEEMDTAATISGTAARKDANTNANTASAPRAPMSVSSRTPGPSSAEPADSAWMPVSSTS